MSGTGNNVHPCLSTPSNVVNVMRDVRTKAKETKRRKKETNIRVENELIAQNRRRKTIPIEDNDDENLRLGLLASQMEFKKSSAAGYSRGGGGTSGAGGGGTSCAGGGSTSGAGSSVGMKRYFDVDLAKGQGDTQQTRQSLLMILEELGPSGSMPMTSLVIKLIALTSKQP
jgi:hypothetical protein